MFHPLSTKSRCRAIPETTLKVITKHVLWEILLAFWTALERWRTFWANFQTLPPPIQFPRSSNPTPPFCQPTMWMYYLALIHIGRWHRPWLSSFPWSHIFATKLDDSFILHSPLAETFLLKQRPQRTLRAHSHHWRCVKTYLAPGPLCCLSGNGWCRPENVSIGHYQSPKSIVDVLTLRCLVNSSTT